MFADEAGMGSDNRAGIILKTSGSRPIARATGHRVLVQMQSEISTNGRLKFMHLKKHGTDHYFKTSSAN